MAKKLTLSNVLKESNKLNDKIKSKVVDRFGNEYEITVNKYFKKTNIPMLVGEYVSITEQLKETVDNYVDNMYIFNILIIKHMTNVPIPKDTFEIIAYVNELINIDVLSQIVDALPKDELDKVIEWIIEALSKIPHFTPEVKDLLVNSRVVDKNGNI